MLQLVRVRSKRLKVRTAQVARAERGRGVFLHREGVDTVIVLSWPSEPSWQSVARQGSSCTPYAAARLHLTRSTSRGAGPLRKHSCGALQCRRLSSVSSHFDWLR